VARFAGEWNQCNWWQFSGAGLEKLLLCCDFDRIEHRARDVLRDVWGAFADPTFVCHARPRAG